MDRRFKKKTRLIKEFSKGQHSDDMGLEEEYLDWFFLHHFNREPGWWRKLDDDKINSLIVLEQQKDKEYWDTWVKMFKQMFGGK